jgi:hypothetical protein
MDDPEMILNGALENHYKMINEFKERFVVFMLPVFPIRIRVGPDSLRSVDLDPDPDPEGQK